MRSGLKINPLLQRRALRRGGGGALPLLELDDGDPILDTLKPPPAFFGGFPEAATSFIATDLCGRAKYYAPKS